MLVGFYDDININISDNSRIAAIILNIKQKINPYSIELHKLQAKKELLELDYPISIVNEWIENIE